MVASVYFGSQMLYEVELPDRTVLQIEVADPQYHPIFSQVIKWGWHSRTAACMCCDGGIRSEV